MLLREAAGGRVEESVELTKLAEQRGGLVQVGFMRRFDPAIRALTFLERYGDVDTTVLALGLVSGPLAVMTGSREDGRGEDVRIEAIGSRDSANAGFNARCHCCSAIPTESRSIPRTAARSTASPRRTQPSCLTSLLPRAKAGRACNPRDALGTLLVAVAAEQPPAANAPLAVTQAATLLEP